MTSLANSKNLVHQKQSSSLTLNDVIFYLDQHRNLLLQGLQYGCLLIAWYFQTQWKPEKTLQVFKLRRLFRIGFSINFIPEIKKTFNNYGHVKSGQNLFQLLRFVFKFLFYNLDNVAVILDIIQHPKYYLFRRASYSLLALALTFAGIQYLIRLRGSFKKEAELKTKMVGELTPKEVLTQLNFLDEQRLRLYIQLFRCFGDLFPALQRTNVTQIILRTRINKGTVALCGLAAVILQILRQVLK